MVMYQGLVLLMAVACASAQFANSGFLFGGGTNVGSQTNVGFQGGAQGFDSGGRSVDATQRNGLFSNVGLKAQSNGREAFAGQNQQAVRENVAASDAFAENLFAGHQFGAEEVANKESVANVDAIETSKGDRTLSVALIDKQAFDVGNKVSVSTGARDSAGAKVAGNTQVAAQAKEANDLRAASNAQSLDSVQADAAKDALLGVTERIVQQNQERVQGRDFFEQQFGQAAGANQAGGFGLFDGFGNNFFGRRRR